MTMSRRRIVSIVLSVILPPVVAVILVIVNEELHPWGPGGLGMWAMPLSVVAGFLFLAREFRIYALPIALVYFPAMWWITVLVSVSIVIGLYGGP